MDKKTNNGLCDESLDKFGQFMKMIEETSYLSEMDTQCSICLDLMHRPHEIDPCKHRFCQPCLIRMSQAGRMNCPLCRGAINGLYINSELDEAIQNQHREDYLRRQKLEIMSNFYEVPMNYQIILINRHIRGCICLCFECTM